MSKLQLTKDERELWTRAFIAYVTSNPSKHISYAPDHADTCVNVFRNELAERTKTPVEAALASVLKAGGK